MDVRVRRAEPSEAGLVHHIMQAAFAEYLGVLPVASGAHAETVADVEQTMARGGAVLAFVADEPVGSARFELLADERDVMYVGRVSVLPTHRRQGVASAMMAFLEDVARDYARSVLLVGVRDSLPSNVGLYQHLGYAVRSIAPHDRGPDRVWMMVKRLTPQGVSHG